MTMTKVVIKRIVCLANSRKHSERCIAGRELIDDEPAGWLRPVSNRNSGMVSNQEMEYEDGSVPCVRDVIDVPLLKYQPEGYQQENWLLSPQHYWEKVDRVKWKDLARLRDPAGPLWVNGYRTNNGYNDRIPIARATKLRSSLRFIRVDTVRLVVSTPGEAFEDYRRRVQAEFSYAGEHYAFWVTDPLYENRYASRSLGTYEIGESYLTVSLGVPHKDGFCYKLVAAIIARPK